MEALTACSSMNGAGPVAPALAFTFALLAVFAAARLGTWLDPATAQTGSAPAPLGGRDKVRLCSPLIGALVATSIFVAALAFSGFFWLPLERAPAFVRMETPQAMSTEAASQLLWGVSAAALVVTGLIVIWIAGDALRASHTASKKFAVRAVLGVAAVAALGLVVLATLTGGFGGAISKAMLGGLVCRNNLPNLFVATDSLSALTGGAAVAAILTACLMAAPASDLGRSAAAAELARRWTILDRLLYAGAAMLIAGMIEVIVLHSWALAPFSGTSEVKAQVDLCAPGKVPGMKPEQLASCSRLAEAIDNASTVDELKKFVRSLAITLGAGFSLLLASLYVPAAIVLQLRAARAGPRAAADADARELQPAFAGAPGARLFKIAATVAPLATGLLSALVDMKFS